jgi:hypothetical protein
MDWQNQLIGDTLTWLLEPSDPGVRSLALRDLLDRGAGDQELKAAREAAHREGPIATVLGKMRDEGYWEEPGAGYRPKYTSTVWALILLAQLGADAAMDSRIPRACRYLLDHALTEYGQFSASGNPGGTVDCLQGNMCASLLDLGFEDPRLEGAYEWMARTVTGEGVAAMGEKSTPIRYYSGKCGAGFQCGANNKQPCAWGAAKVMLAFGKLPANQRTPIIERSIQEGVDFLFSVDPATAQYPSGYNEKPSGNWWKFGFPVYYITDILQIAEALVHLGYGKDPRLANTLKLIREKQDERGRWALEYHYTGKTWGNYGQRKEPNKWVTLRSLRVLKCA